jgi:hypothetical protein
VKLPDITEDEAMLLAMMLGRAVGTVTGETLNRAIDLANKLFRNSADWRQITMGDLEL